MMKLNQTIVNVFNKLQQLEQSSHYGEWLNSIQTEKEEFSLEALQGSILHCIEGISEDDAKPFLALYNELNSL